MTVNLIKLDKTGKEVANELEEIGITANKNTVPNDPKSPFVTSGVRIGVPAATTRGFKEEEMKQIGKIIADCRKNYCRLYFKKRYKRTFKTKNSKIMFRFSLVS